MSKRASILSPARIAYLRDVAALLGGQYGSKALELLVIVVATRTLDAATVGVVFLAESAGAVSFKLFDFGLYPVLVRRTSREEADRMLARWATVFRTAIVALIVLCFAAIAWWRFPERALFASGFFLLRGVKAVHEVPRAVVAGHSRFVLTATGNFGAKGAEVAIAIVGLLSGMGLGAWLLGRAVGQLGLLIVMYRQALVGLSPPVQTTLPTDPSSAPPTAPPTDPQPIPQTAPGTSLPPAGLVREGLPFWLNRALNLGAGRLSTVLVTFWFGFTGAAHVGVAEKIIEAGLAFMGAMTQVAFPALARDRRKWMSRLQIVTVLALSALLGIGAFVTAPWLVHLVMGKAQPTVVALVRVLAPVLSLTAIARATETWLQAKGDERIVAWLSLVDVVVIVVALSTFLPTIGILGSGWARLAQSGVKLLAAGGVAFAAIEPLRVRHSEP